MRILVKVLLSLLVANIALAENPPPRIQDEGGTLAPYFNLNCVGSNITCTTSGVNATVTVPLPSALAANGANCSAGNYPLGVDAAGAVESCTADDDVPESGDLAAATLQVVTTAGATSNVATTFSGGLNSLAGGVAGSLQLGSTLSGGAFAGNINIGTDQTIPSAGIVHAIGSLNTFSGADHIAFVYGYGNDIYRLTSPGGANTAIGYFNDLGYGYSSTVIGEDNICRMTESTVVGFSNFVAPTATLAAEVPTQAAVIGSGNVIGVNTDVTTIVGQANSVGANLAQGPSIVGKSNTVTHESVSVLGNNITSTAASRAYLGDSTQTAVISEAYTLPSADGSASQYLKTNGAGATSFDTLTLSDITDYTNNSSTTEMLFNNAGAIDGTSFFTTDGTNLDLTSGELRLDDNVELSLGTGNDSKFYFDGTNAILNPDSVGAGYLYVGDGTTPDDVRAKHIGLADSAVSSSRIIDMDETSSSILRGLSSVVTHTGTTSAMRAMLFTANHSGTSTTGAKAPIGSLITSQLGTDTTGAITVLGTLTTAQNNVALATTGGTGQSVVFANRFAVSSVGGNTTDSKINAMSVHGQKPSAFTGAVGVVNRWAGLFSGTLQVNSDEQFVLEGSDTVIGDSYFLYDSTDTDIEQTVDGTQVADYDNDQIDYAVPIQQDACRANFTRFGLGCIQTDEEGNGTWDVAREDCYDTYGGRLPTPEELMIAANNLALTNEIDDEEWTNEINYDAAAVECGYLKLNAGTADESADYADEACGTAESYRCFVPFAGGI